MQICLEGPSGNWDWFDAKFTFGLDLDFERIEDVCGTDDPMVIDIEYDEDSDLEGILKFDGMGYTPVSALIEQVNDLATYDDWDLKRIAAYVRTRGDLEDAKNDYENHFYVNTDDPNPTSLAYTLVSEDGIDEEMAATYFDYEALGRDLLLDGYETDETDEYTVGEEYIDGVYGSVEAYIEAVGVDGAEGYFDFDAYGRTLDIGWTYDDISGMWISESVKRNTKNRKKLHIKESASPFKIDLVSQEAARVHNWNDLDAVISSLLSIDKNLYLKYSEMYRQQVCSPAYIGSEISDELYYMVHPELGEDVTISIDTDEEPLVIKIPEEDVTVCPVCGLEDCECDALDDIVSDIEDELEDEFQDDSLIDYLDDVYDIDEDDLSII